MISEIVAPPSIAVAMSRTTWVTPMILRRWTMSANAPASNPNSSAGTVLAVWTSATMSGDGVKVVINHAATVACIV